MPCLYDVDLHNDLQFELQQLDQYELQLLDLHRGGLPDNEGELDEKGRDLLHHHQVQLARAAHSDHCKP